MNLPYSEIARVGDLPSVPLGQTNIQRRTGERWRTFESLTASLRHALPIRDYQINRDRYIILSDVHKGSRQVNTDEFLHNEGLYCHALQYYAAQGYRLILNGDIEEGWKLDYHKIVESYADTAFAAEREFADQGPSYYYRIFGNHDHDWADPRQVVRYLKPVLGPIQVYPAIVLGGRIVITHGHQGDPHSDQRARLSRMVVRHLWRPVQHFTGLRHLQDAANHILYWAREQHLAEWAHANRLLLIAGHTHRPMLNTHEPPTYYVNNGCCVHLDGITGLEIDRGEMRLVKWGQPSDAANKAGRDPQRIVFQSADLAELLARL
jgi:UDP-2,3-diacylglucosamine pyrophosphatase LpxH